MRRFLVLSMTCMAFIFQMFAQEQKQIDALKANYLQIILPSDNRNKLLMDDLYALPSETRISDQQVQELFNRIPPTEERIRQIISLIGDDGGFTDINYKDQLRSGWQPKQHAERLLEMCKSYKDKKSRYFNSKELSRYIHKIMNFWFSTKPVCPNWWYNEIGVPRAMGDAFLIMEKELSNEELMGAVDVMSHAKFGMTGQNKVWLAANVMVRGLLENDFELISKARDIIVGEIQLGQAEGIKKDWSFHQHGPQQQFGNYGMSFVSSMSFFLKLFKGTELAIDNDKEQILKNLVNKGYRWIIWNKDMDMNSLGRQFFHNGSVHKALITRFAMNEMDINEKDPAYYPLIGHKHFECSDHTVHREKGWMASLKMCSSRTQGSELVNEDNMKGYYMGDGALYIYQRGDEYMDALPVWDWRKVPGTTVYESDAAMPKLKKNGITNPTPRVGGISYDNQGISSMEYIRDGIYAKKAWIFTHDMVIALGSAISSDSTLDVTTAIEQSLASTPMMVMENNNTLKEISVSQRVQRALHDGKGYIMLDGQTMIARKAMQSGQWSDIMGMYKPEVISKEIVTIYINHGKNVRNGHYAYAIIPETSETSLKAFRTKDIQIIKNDANAQIITGKALGDLLWAVAYKPFSTIVDKAGLKIEIEGLYCFKKNGKIWDTVSFAAFDK